MSVPYAYGSVESERAPFVKRELEEQKTETVCSVKIWSCLKREGILTGFIRVQFSKFFYVVFHCCWEIWSSKKKKWRGKWLETLHILLMLSRHPKHCCELSARISWMHSRDGMQYFFLSFSDFAMQWTWAREMSLLVNAVSCVRKWSDYSQRITLDYFFHSNFSGFAFGNDTHFAAM